MIKYIGSKRLLVHQIERVIATIPNARRVLDLFSGTARVGHALKRAGYAVTANDHTAYAHRLAQCYVQADRERWLPQARELVAELNALPPDAGYFTQTFCEASRYFQPKNGARIDAIRNAIAGMQLPTELESIALVSLMEAADRVDSTVGLQMAYLKQWAKRAFNDLELRVPDLLPGGGAALGLDALECANSLADAELDVVYLDPPYNQHRYLGNYHVWETLVRWDAPEVYGIACKRIDCKTYKSAFNSRRGIRGALEQVVKALRARYLMVSFNNEGYLSQSELLEILSERGAVQMTSVDFPRYVGAKIGIYNPQGQKTGTVGRLRNRELLFLVDCEREGRVRLEPPLSLEGALTPAV